MAKDLYAVLGVERGADAAEIRRQYLKLSRQYHPDKVSDDKKEEAEAKFKELSSAYEVLNDEQSRAYYDQTGKAPGEGGGGPPGGGMSFGMGGGMPFPFDMGNLFGMFGGGRGGPSGAHTGRRPGKPPPRKTQIPMTLKDFYFGRKLQIHLERSRFCGGCKGEGALNIKACGDCNGTGVKVTIIQMGPMMVQNQGPCITCHGAGKTKTDTCGQCNGSKFIKQDKNLELTITKGMKHGDIITFPGESSHQEDFNEAGDVLVELVSADEDHGWERFGDMLKHRVGLTLGESLCGKVVRLDGHPAHENGVFIKIPCGVQNRQEIVVEGLGMPRTIGDGFGDAVIVLSVLPTKEERTSLEQNIDTMRSVFNPDAGSTDASLIWSAKPLVY
jgi:DnaJ-class molecular chaperone